MFKNLTLKSRIFCSFLLYIVGLSLPGSFATVYFYSHLETFNPNPQILDSGLIADRLSESKIDIKESLLNYVTTKDRSFIQQSEQTLSTFNQQIDLLNKSEVWATLNQDDWQKLQQLTQHLTTLNQYIFSLIESGKTEQAIRVLGADETRQTFQQMSQAIAEIRTAEIQTYTGQLKQVNTTLNTLFLAIAVSTVCLALLSTIVSFPLRKRILATAQEIMTKMLNISGAIAQEMNAHEQTTHEEAQMVSMITPDLQHLTEFCNVSPQKSALVYGKLAEISVHIRWIRDQLEQLKSLRELSDRLVYDSKKISVNVSVKAWRDHTETYKSFVLLNTELRTLTNQAQKLSQKINEILAAPESLDRPTIQQNIDSSDSDGGQINIYSSDSPQIWGVGGAKGVGEDIKGGGVGISQRPTWGNDLSASEGGKSWLHHQSDSASSYSMDHILADLEQILLQISELAISSQEQSANSQKLLQTNQELEQTTGTTACGIGETNLQIKKLNQLMFNLQLFLKN
jgi:CHASE3 domain sensor protein